MRNEYHEPIFAASTLRRRNSNDSPTSDSSTSSTTVAEKTPLSRAESLASENSYPSTRSGSIVSVIERISFGRANGEEEKKFFSKQQGEH